MLTQRTAKGVSVTLAVDVVGRLLGVVSQVVTGLYLLDEQFGLFGMAIGIATAAGLLRGGDLQIYLVSLPPTRRRFRNGSAFWLAQFLFLIGIVPVLMLGSTIADHLGEPDVVPLVWILCAAMLLAPLRFVLRSRLNARLEFTATARASLINTSVQYPLVIVLAIVLQNAFALVVPVLIGFIAEMIYLIVRARPTRSDFRPCWRLMPAVLYRTRWLIAVAAMTSLWTSGDYLIAEFFVPATVLGTYYFGYQLAVQPGRLFLVTVTNLLVPVVRRVGRDPERLRAVTRRLLGTGGFVIAIMNVAMLAGIAPLEMFVWRGLWSDSVLAVQVLCIGLTFMAILGIATAPLLADRRYVESLVSNGMRAVAVVLGAGIGAAIWATVDGIAVAGSISMTIFGLGTIGWIGTRYGLGFVESVLHVVRCTLPVIIAGVVAAVIGELLLEGLGGDVTASIPAGIAAGGSFTLLALFSMRLLPRETRAEIVGLTPGRFRGILAKVVGQSLPTHDA